MPVHVDTASVEVRSRASYWAQANDDLFFPIALQGHERALFAGRAEGFVLGPALVRRLSAGPSRALRTSADISRGDPELLELTLLLRGHQEREQGARRAVLRAGDITMVDSSRPFTVTCETAFEMLAFSIPKRALGLDADRLLRSTAMRIPTDSGLGTVVGPYLRSVADGLADGRVEESDAGVGEAIIHLIRSLFADRRALGPGAALLRDVQETIESRLRDPLLSPASVAGQHFVSVRTLQSLFADAGMTVSGWIRAQRMERCRRDLLDAALADRTVAAIAMSWGFPNPAHFSRVYRQAFGRSPSEDRGELRERHSTLRER